MVARVRVNGSAQSTVSVADRGLCYGDGLFETIWWHHGHAPLWPRHVARLAEGCRRLGMPAPDRDMLWREVLAVADDLDRAVVRVTCTRGSGPRGYRMPSATRPTYIVSAAPIPHPPRRDYDDGVVLRWCATRWGTQPALAGLKHLNRLEQVLARSEWQDDNVDEGLMLDVDDRVISATAANVFVVHDGHLHTPALQRCGVAGTARAEVLAHHPDALIDTLTAAALYAADEVFLTSAVRGIVPVRSLAGHQWAVGPVTRTLQSSWRRAGLPPQVDA